MSDVTTSDLWIHKNQGEQEDGRTFGYVVAHESDGGYFFVWGETLEETLDSLDPDQQDEPTFGVGVAREFLAPKIASSRRFFSDEE